MKRLAKKGKEASSVDLYYLGQAEQEENEKKKKQKASQKAKKNTKKKKKNEPKKEKQENTTKSVSSKLEDAYNMEEEIIIGIPKSSPPPKEKKQKQNKQKKVEQPQKVKEKPKKQKKSNKTNKTNKKLTPKQEKALKRRKLLLAIIKWMVLCILLAGSLIYFLLSPLFNITDIVIKGNSKITTEQIQSLSQIKIGDNIFKMQKSDVIQKIKQNPYINSVTIRRDLPNIVEIEVEERQATLQLQYVNSYVYLNNQGYLLEINEQKLENSPILRGISTKEENIKPGNRLEKEDLEKLEVVLSILESAKSNEIGDKITQIDISEKNDFVLYLDEEKKIVHMGDEKDLSTKMLWIKTILEKEQGIEGELFLNEGMDSVYFREKV